MEAWLNCKFRSEKVTGDPLHSRACTQHDNINRHSRAHLPGCVLKMAAWLGFACSGFFTDTIYNRHARTKCTIVHPVWMHCSCPCPPGNGNFEQTLSFAVQYNIAGLCAISPGCALCLLPLNQGTHISPTFCAVIAWVSADQTLCCNMGSFGNNAFWSLGTTKAADVILDQCSAGHAEHSRAWNRVMHTIGPMLRNAGLTIWKARLIKLVF